MFEPDRVRNYVGVVSQAPLPNAAVEFIRRGADRISTAGKLPDDFGQAALVEDFVFEDRSSGGGTNLGRTRGIRDYANLVATSWQVGSGRPRWSIRETIAVRGQRCAAVVDVIDYGDDMVSESISCIRLDPDLRRVEHGVRFDTDAVDDAVALLDEWHAEITD